jgi:hypothetical protein
MRRLEIGWKRKAAAFRLLDALPGADALHYAIQRHVTRSFPRDLAEHDGWQIEHARAFQRFYQGNIGRARLFEFGAGWDLHSSLVQWCFGVSDQVVVDIKPLARLELVNHAIDHLSRHPPAGAARSPVVALVGPIEDALRREYGIHYVAPADARQTGLADSSVDLFCTTSVLEHVPPGALREILRECHRIASADAVMSHVIDYTDHYAHADASIGEYNFLRFTDAEWARFNPGIHYQNRLRHHEYGEIFREAGFVPLAEHTIAAAGSGDPLRGIAVAGRFRGMPREQLTVRTGHWVLARR